MSVITSLKPEDKSLAEKALILRTYSGFEICFILPLFLKISTNVLTCLPKHLNRFKDALLTVSFFSIRKYFEVIYKFRR